MVRIMRYTGEHLNKIFFPLGGIGTGCISLAGNGSLVDWEIFNRPNKGSINPYSGFFIRAEYPDGKSVTKALLGDWKGNLSGEYTRQNFKGYGFGPNDSTFCGFPHFRHVTFDATFPEASLTFADPDFPGKVILKAFNPLIPLDADNSGLPAAFFEITIQNPEENVRYTAVLTVGNPFGSTVNTRLADDGFTAVMLKNAQLQPHHKEYGDITVKTAVS